MAKNEKCGQKDTKVITGLLKGLAAGCLLTVIVFTAMAFVLTNTSISESVVPIVSVITTALSALLAGFGTAKSANSKGIFWGIGAGLIYMAILFIVLFSSQSEFSMSIGKMAGIIAAVAGGAIGGILGIDK